jgi:hypothetical protein
MKNPRKDQSRKKNKRLAMAYSDIFRGLYWRHEFARRNDAVSTASRDLAKALGFKPTRFEIFIQNGRPLTDELIDLCRVGSMPAKTALREFLEKYKVLPTAWNPQTKSPYFPMEFGLRESERVNYIYDTLLDCKTLFNNLLLFEAFSISDLKMGRPVMFPLMPLIVFGRKMEQLHLGDFPAPVLLDRFAPADLIGHYSDALDCEMEWGDYEKAKKTKKMADKDGAKSNRVPWESVSAYIRIYSHSLALKEGEKVSGFKYEYYSKHMEVKGKKPVRDPVANAIASYDSQLEAAKKQIENYQDII